MVLEKRGAVFVPPFFFVNFFPESRIFFAFPGHLWYAIVVLL
jgi:hypothetical protein